MFHETLEHYMCIALLFTSLFFLCSKFWTSVQVDRNWGNKRKAGNKRNAVYGLFLQTNYGKDLIYSDIYLQEEQSEDGHACNTLFLCLEINHCHINREETSTIEYLDSLLKNNDTYAWRALDQIVIEQLFQDMRNPDPRYGEYYKSLLAEVKQILKHNTLKKINLIFLDLGGEPIEPPISRVLSYVDNL